MGLAEKLAFGWCDCKRTANFDGQLFGQFSLGVRRDDKAARIVHCTLFAEHQVYVAIDEIDQEKWLLDLRRQPVE